MTIDLDSLNDLIAEADVEGFIADGSPADEYESEVEEVFPAVKELLAKGATKEGIVAIFDAVWRKNFSLPDAELETRRAAFEQIAERILQHFG